MTTTLRKEAENLGTVDYQLRMPPGIPFPTRMTVIHLDDGSLALVSPVPIDDALAEELAAWGRVSYLVAPNALHHLHLPAAKKRYPDARLLGPAVLRAKQPSLTFEPLILGEHPTLAASLDVEIIGGAPKASEAVFFHRSSRTLIVTDFVFNVEKAPSMWTAAMLFTTGTLGRLAQSRIWNFIVDDKAAARTSSERLFAWDFDRLIVAHGEVIAAGAKARLAGALTRTAPRLQWSEAGAA